MPRLKESTRDARRLEIANAAVRALQRDGFAHTSIADIVAEQGGSTGGIYAHFADKADLARYLATRIVGWRVETLAQLSASDPAPRPSRILRTMLAGLHDEVPFAVVLQFWAQATTDPSMREAVQANMAEFRTVLRRVVAPWVALQHGRVDPTRVVQGIMALGQGYIVHSTLNGPTDPVQYLAQIAAVIDSFDDPA